MLSMLGGVFMLPSIARAADPMTTNFFNAFEKWDEKALKRMLMSGMDINVKNDDGFTALMLAVKQKDLNKVKFFVRRNADVNACSDSGETAYSISFAEGDEAIQKYLMLMNASAANNCVKPLPPPPPPPPHHHHHDAPPPAPVVVETPAPAVVVQAQVPGVYVQGQVPGGQVVVQGTVPGGQVVIQGQVPTAQVYVQVPGEPVAAQDPVPPPPPHHATLVPFEEYENVRLGGDAKSFFLAIEKNDIRAIRFLIDHGYDINTFAEGRTSPLTRAVQRRNMTMVQEILAFHARINELDSWGRSALSYAVENDDLEIAGILLRNGADQKKGRFAKSFAKSIDMNHLLDRY